MAKLDMYRYFNPLSDREVTLSMYGNHEFFDVYDISTWTSPVTAPSGRNVRVTSPWVIEHSIGDHNRESFKTILWSNEVCIFWYPTIANLALLEITMDPMWSLVKYVLGTPSYKLVSVSERMAQHIPILLVPDSAGDSYVIFAGKDTGSDFPDNAPPALKQRIKGWDIGTIVDEGLHLPEEYKFLTTTAHHIGDWQGHYVFNAYSNRRYRR